MVNTPEEAIANARKQSTRGPSFPIGTCLMQVRLCYGVPGGVASAAASWAGAHEAVTTSQASKIPRGVPIFWTGGSHGYGHIAISTGNGRCLSSDIRRRGFFDEVPIDEIQNRWGLHLAGYAGTFNGTHVWSPAPPPAVKVGPARAVDHAAAPATHYDALYEGMTALLNQHGPNIQKKYPARRKLVDGARALLAAAPVPASRKVKK